ncbi:hypothetical protein H0X06_01840 [Candidatus Dependentiae bacterium]|nr:hypothetical protein [Candidatus Dependentiae bacterium]
MNNKIDNESKNETLQKETLALFIKRVDNFYKGVTKKSLSGGYQNHTNFFTWLTTDGLFTECLVATHRDLNSQIKNKNFCKRYWFNTDIVMQIMSFMMKLDDIYCQRNSCDVSEARSTILRTIEELLKKGGASRPLLQKIGQLYTMVLFEGYLKIAEENVASKFNYTKLSDFLGGEGLSDFIARLAQGKVVCINQKTSSAQAEYIVFLTKCTSLFKLSAEDEQTVHLYREMDGEETFNKIYQCIINKSFINKNFEDLCEDSYNGNYDYIVSFLGRHKQLLHKVNDEGKNLLHYAIGSYCEKNNHKAWQVFAYLLNEGADITQTTKDMFIDHSPFDRFLNEQVPGEKSRRDHIRTILEKKNNYIGEDEHDFYRCPETPPSSTYQVSNITFEQLCRYAYVGNKDLIECFVSSNLNLLKEVNDEGGCLLNYAIQGYCEGIPGAWSVFSYLLNKGSIIINATYKNFEDFSNRPKYKESGDLKQDIRKDQIALVLLKINQEEEYLCPQVAPEIEYEQKCIIS